VTLVRSAHVNAAVSSVWFHNGECDNYFLGGLIVCMACLM